MNWFANRCSIYHPGEVTFILFFILYENVLLIWNNHHNCTVYLFQFHLQLHTQCIIDLLSFFLCLLCLWFDFWFIYNLFFCCLYQMIYWLKSENTKIINLKLNLVLYVVCRLFNINELNMVNFTNNNKLLYIIFNWTFQLVQLHVDLHFIIAISTTHVCKYKV